MCYTGFTNANDFCTKEVELDSLSQNTIESLFKEAPSTVSNDTTSSVKRSKLNAYPYVFYTPETKFAGGAGGVFVFYTGKDKELNPSKIGFGGYYSSNKQYKLSMNPAFYFAKNELYFELPTSFGFYVNKYWGIGDNTLDNDSTGYAVQDIRFYIYFSGAAKILFCRPYRNYYRLRLYRYC